MDSTETRCSSMSVLQISLLARKPQTLTKEEKRLRTNAYMKLFYVKNRETIKARVRLYRSTHLEADKEYYQRDKDKKNAQRKTRRNRPREKLTDEQRAIRIKESEGRFRENHPDYGRIKYLKHRNAALASAKKYRTEHPEQTKRARAKYYKNNRDKSSQNGKAWRAKNTIRVLYHIAKRRALKRGAPIGDLEALAAWEHSVRSKKYVICYWCMTRISGVSCNLDHIVPLSKGGAHAVENLCVSCQPCNSRKYNSLPQDWNKRLPQPRLFF